MLRRKHLRWGLNLVVQSGSKVTGRITLPPIYITVIGILIIISTLLLSAFSYSKAIKLPELKARLSGNQGQWFQGQGMKPTPFKPKKLSIRRAKAAFVILVRNREMLEITQSIRSMEERFNKNFQYPYVFLNDEPFTEEFKEWTSKAASSKCSYALIESKDWDEGPNIDQEKALAGRERLMNQNVPYADSIPYRKMCRYQSGFFWRHPILDQYDYYWRVEPHVRYSCDLNYDPFLFMQDNKKKYGFALTIKEYEKTIPSLWQETKNFIKNHPQHLAQPNSMDWISNDKGKTYNLCHFWSNFEIASLDFWRSPAYRAYFNHLEKTGGFFYERWGDAPVHSIAAALFLKPDEIHFFQDIGYRHTPFQHCPKGRPNECACNPNDWDSFEEDGYACTKQWKEFVGWKDL